jgi:hypothetical protein
MTAELRKLIKDPVTAPALTRRPELMLQSLTADRTGTIK